MNGGDIAVSFLDLLLRRRANSTCIPIFALSSLVTNSIMMIARQRANRNLWRWRRRRRRSIGHENRAIGTDWQSRLCWYLFIYLFIPLFITCFSRSVFCFSFFLSFSHSRFRSVSFAFMFSCSSAFLIWISSARTVTHDVTDQKTDWKFSVCCKSLIGFFILESSFYWNSQHNHL